MKPQPKTGYPVHDLIRNRWSPRAFASRPVEPETILSLFEAARWAASAFNEQPWRFIYAPASDPEKYARLFQCLRESNQAWAKSAPVLALTMIQTHFSHNGKPNKWAAHDLGLAVGNLTAQATSLGLYVHSMAGFDPEKAKSLFSLPAGLEPLTMIALGYRGDPETLPPPLKERELAPPERKPLSELLL